jgi:hypothetical protein
MNFRGGVGSEQDLEGLQDTLQPPKERLLIPSPAKEVSVLKRGMPSTLTSEDETTIVSYKTEMKSIRFRFSATAVRRQAFHISERRGIEKNPSILHPIWGVLVVMQDPTKEMSKFPTNLKIIRVLKSSIC